MIKQEFDELAKKVLVALIQHHEGAAPPMFYAKQAVEITNEFAGRLAARHIDIAKATTKLMDDEIVLLYATPHPQVIECIKRVKERTGLDLKASKDLVDKARTDLGLM